MSKTLEELKVKELTMLQQVNKVREQIQHVKDLEVLPALKEKYEGKYFKFVNSCGVGERWPLYSRCVKVSGENQAHFDSFKTTPYGSEFKINNLQYGFHLAQIPITKAEYNKALKAFSETLNKLKT